MDDKRKTPAFGGSPRRLWLITLLIVFLGAGTSVAFLAVGIKSENEAQKDEFARSALDLVKKSSRRGKITSTRLPGSTVDVAIENLVDESFERSTNIWWREGSTFRQRNLIQTLRTQSETFTKTKPVPFMPRSIPMSTTEALLASTTRTPRAWIRVTTPLFTSRFVSSFWVAGCASTFSH